MIKKCAKCGAYTLGSACKCGSATAEAHPPKFGSDRYGKYRRMQKEMMIGG